MAVDTSDAARALDEIADTKERVMRREAYREASPYFIMWGVVWLLGNGAMELLPPETAQWGWAVLIPLAIIGSILLGNYHDRARPGEPEREVKARRHLSLKIMLMIFLAFGLVIAAGAVFWPVEYREMNAFISLVAGFAYMTAGVAAGWRWIAVGATVVALVLAGHLLLEQHYYAWMAVVGGGSLIFAGLWLRKG